MKYAAGIIGILGAIAGLFLGIKWFSDLSSEAGQTAAAFASSAGQLGDMFAGLKYATYALLACGVVGLAVSVLILMLKGNRWANAGLLIVAGFLPLVFSTTALFGVPMVLAGLLAFAVKYQPKAQAVRV